MKCDQVDILHGVTIADPFRWLEDGGAPATREWIDAQNVRTQEYLADVGCRTAIRERITHLWDFEKYDVPVRRGDRLFFTRNDGLQAQSVLYVQDGLAGERRVLLDPNHLSDDGTVSLANWSVSPDGRWLAYGTSSGGSDWNEWRIRDVDSGADLADHLVWVKFSPAAWLPDSSGFYYSGYDAPEGDELQTANFHQKLHFHRRGTPQSDDVLVYERPDHPKWGFWPHVTDDGRYLVVSVWRGTDREKSLFYRPLGADDGAMVELIDAWDASYDFVGNDGDRFFVFTDLDAERGRLVAVDLDTPGRGDWSEVLPETDDTLREVQLTGGKLVASYLHDAHSRVRVHAKDGAFVRDVPLPGIGTTMGFGGRDDDPRTFLLFTGFTTPPMVFSYDVVTGEQAVFQAPDVDFDPDDFVTEQVFVTSRDGTRVPAFVSRRKDVLPNGELPTFLYGYGGFNIPLTPAFSVSRLVWMEMGGVYVVANLRGGGEYGESWHRAGTRATKQNTFDDFISVGEWLIENGYTNSRRLAIGGGSNGGLLVGACLVQRPDLWGACLPDVGVLDMLRFHRFTIGWAWISDYGSPDDPDDFRVLLAYSPLHNVKPGVAYPPTLISTGDHDDRVVPAHSFKFAAALQDAQAGEAPVLIRIETRAGHGAGKPTAMIIEGLADKWAFLAKVFGLAFDGA